MNTHIAVLLRLLLPILLCSSQCLLFGKRLNPEYQMREGPISFINFWLLFSVSIEMNLTSTNAKQTLKMVSEKGHSKAVEDKNQWLRDLRKVRLLSDLCSE